MEFQFGIGYAGKNTAGHLPADKRGALGDITELNARRIRALLLQKLNR